MGFEIHNWGELDPEQQAALLERPAVRDDAGIRQRVAQIIDAVRNEGDTALQELTERFDGVAGAELRVGAPETAAATKEIGAAAVEAIDRAIANVRAFHERQLAPPLALDTAPGVRCERLSHPLDSVGLYVPAGTAPLPSAAIMLAVPAAIAGCPLRILCTPPRPDGRADPAVVVAAARAGITEIFKVGGAQAIAAMAYGTATIPKVCKIFGPGNAYVTSAKVQVASDPRGAALDMPAGPSEVLVIADDGANAEYVASDLLAQAEHGVDSQVMLVTTSADLAARVQAAIDEQLQTLSRAEICRGALEHSRGIVVDSIADAIEVSNRYAPEHLIVQTTSPRDLLPELRNAGSVFLGEWTPEAVGDYCSGTNHVLPTYGYARNYSGLGVEQFMRSMTVQELSRDGLAGLGQTVTTLAGLEGLDAHAASVSRRLRSTP